MESSTKPTSIRTATGGGERGGTFEALGRSKRESTISCVNRFGVGSYRAAKSAMVSRSR